MIKNYKEIQFPLGKIEYAIEELKRHKNRGELAFGEFNGQKLYSDIDDLDSAYKKVTGKSYEEFKADEKKGHDDYQEEKRKHEETIPEQTAEWIKKGSEVLDIKYREKWNQIVPIRLSDLYRGFQLGACLEIVEALNNGISFKGAKEIIEKQGHSGMSFVLVCSMVRAFCDRGSDFSEYVNLD